MRASGTVGIIADGEPLAGKFNRNVEVTGTLTNNGSGGFQIDHPSTPRTAC